MKLKSEEISRAISGIDANSILTSPYISNNLCIIFDSEDNKITYKIYKSVYDPLETELKLIKSIGRNDKLETPLKTEKIELDFLLPGKKVDHIIAFGRKGDVWEGFLRDKKIQIQKRIGKICIDEINKDNGDIFCFFDIFEPINMVVYFTKKTRDFACLVVNEEDKFSLILNFELFSAVEKENAVLEFENSKAIWNSSADNLDLFFYNNNTGLSHLNFPRNKINKSVPISITNLKKVDSEPIEVCCINDTVYAVSKSKLYVFPEFKKYRTLKQIDFNDQNKLIWFEPQYKRCKYINPNNKLYDFILLPTISEPLPSEISNQVLSETFNIHKDFQVKSVGNKHFGFFIGNSDCYLWAKNEHLSSLKNHNITSKKIKAYIPDAKVSLLKLKELKLIDLDSLANSVITAVPIGLLKLTAKKRHFTKQEDLYLINHAYRDLTFLEIARDLNRTPIVIYTHLKSSFGSPSCEEHDNYKRTCKGCINSRTLWVEKSEQIIGNKTYYERKVDEDFPKFDYEKWVRNDKKRRLERSISFFKKTLPTQIYKNILNFILDTDLLKGRSVYKVFKQCIQIFMEDFLSDCYLNENFVPTQLLELYFSIKKDMKTLKVIFPLYRKYVNINYGSLGDLNFFYKDLISLRKMYDNEVCEQLTPLLHKFYNLLSKYKILDGYFAALLYKFSNFGDNKFTQKELAEFFSITEVTLRSRLNELNGLLDNTEILEICKKISDYLINKNTIEYKKKFEKERIRLINQKILKLVTERKYEELIEYINFLQFDDEDTLSELSHSIERVSRIGDEKVVIALITFLRKFNYCNSVIFNNLIRYIGSENENLAKNIIFLTLIYKPELKSYDIFNIVDNLSNDQKLSILKFIQADSFRMELKNQLKEYIQQNFNF